MAVSDIIVSPATIWYAPVGETVPAANTIAAGAAWGGNWASLGYTMDPISLSMATNQYDLYVQQLTVAVRTLRTQTDVMISTKLAEFTGTNLKLATDGTLTTQAAGPAAVGMTTVSVSASKSDVSLFAFGIEGVRVSDANVRLPVRLFIPRGSMILKGDIAFAKDSGVGIPIEIKALADSGGVALIVHNVTAPFTS